MVNYHPQVVQLLTQYQCLRLEHIGNGIWKWYSPLTKMTFSVDNPIRSRKTAHAILERAGLPPIIKETRS